MTITPNKPDPNATYVALDSFVTGGNRVVKRGGRLRGDDALVVAAPHLFIHDGATDEEVGVARSAAQRFFDESPPVEPHIQLPGQLSADHPHALRSTKNASFTLDDGSMVVVREGDLVDDREGWVVKARKADRRLFKKANDAA